MYKVLIFGMTDNLGGIETFVLNFIRYISPNEIRFDFITPYEKIAIEDNVKSLGSKVYHLPSRKKNYLKYKSMLKQFMISYAKEYDAVWQNDCLFCNLDILKYAKKYGIQKRIIHAHNSQALGNTGRLIRHTIGKYMLKFYATDYFACSTLAAEWSYPHYIKYVIIPDAIETKKFCYNQEIRIKKREEMNVKNSVVYGCIGRLDFQKNQLFLLDIFKEILKYQSNAILWLIGDGEDRKKIENKAKMLKIDENVLFLGVRKDVPLLLQAMDVMIMPSKFEGLGIAAIESQAAALPSLLADTLPKETRVTRFASYLSLNENAEVWAKTAIKMSLEKERYDTSEEIAQHGFDIRTASRFLSNVLKSS